MCHQVTLPLNRIGGTAPYPLYKLALAMLAGAYPPQLALIAVRDITSITLMSFKRE